MGLYLMPTDLRGLPAEQADMLISEVEGAALDAAPCLADLADETKRARVKALLLRAAFRWASQGFGGISSQSLGQASVNYAPGVNPGDLASFEVARLRLICGLQAAPAGMPVGSFPPAGDYDRLFARPGCR